MNANNRSRGAASFSNVLLALASTLALSGDSVAQSEILRFDGSAAGEGVGTSLAVLGDVDGDGADDLAVGAPGTAARAGRVSVVSGRTGAVLYELFGSGTDDFFGQDVEALGDVDGDQIGDWIAGAPQREIVVADCSGPPGGFGTAYGSGYVTVVSGASGVPLYTLPAPAGTDSFGFSIGAGGDANADGAPDFLTVSGFSMKAHVFDGLTGALIREHDFAFFDGTTYSADFIGAVDGVAGDEYAITWIDLLNCGSGAVRAFRGASGNRYWTDQWCVLGDEYGFNVAGVDDLDGDGTPDVMACGLDTVGFACTGLGFTRSLSGLDGSLIATSTGWVMGGRGRAIEGLGDLDGDGRAEVAVGEPGVVTASSGRDVRVTTGASGAPAFTIAPDDVTDRFGCALAAGDLNGDGLLDLAVGARLDDDGGADAGSVRAFSVTVAPTAYCEAQVNSQGCTPAIFATGMPSVGYNNFRVKASGVLNNKSGLLFWGTLPKQAPFGGGFKCVAAPLRRGGVQQSAGNPPPDDCSGSFSFHFNKPLVNANGLGAGDQIFCQYWSRDAASPSSTNLTDALAFMLTP